MTRPEFAKNEQLLKLAAEALGPLLDRVAFVGGATTILHLTEPIRDVRATADVDVIIDASRAEFQRAEKTLRALGFTHDPKVICRFHKGDLTVDFMPTDPKVLGFSSRWFASGLKTAREVDIGGAKIRVLDFPHFVACKLEAFAGRGNGDYLQSKDIEDLVAALAGRPAFAAHCRHQGISCRTIGMRLRHGLLPCKPRTRAIRARIEPDLPKVGVPWFERGFMSTSTAVDYPAQMIAAFRARESHALKVLWKIRVSDRRPDGEPWRAIDVDRISDWGQKEFVFPPGTTLLPEVVATSATDPTVIEVSASLVP